MAVYSSINARLQGALGAVVASASQITPGTDGNVFPLSGVVTINYITTGGWLNGSRITFIPQAASTFAHSTAAPPGGSAALKNKSAANILNAANVAVSYVYDGSNWVQD